MFSIIPKNQIIKNLINPICKECIFFKNQHSYQIMFSNCMKYGEKNVITGEIKYDTVNSCRTDAAKCGINGHGFEKINAGNHRVSYNIPSFDNPGPGC